MVKELLAASLSTDPNGKTSINANISTTNGPIVFNDPVTLSSSNVTLSSGTGPITFNNTLNVATGISNRRL